MGKKDKKRALQVKRRQKKPGRKLVSATGSAPKTPAKPKEFKITTRLSDGRIKQFLKMISILEGKKDYEVIEEALWEHIIKKLPGLKMPKLKK